MPDKVKIIESYSGYTPPRWVYRSIRGLLGAVPEKYLAGLDCVILTNYENLNRKDKRRRVKHGRKTFHADKVAGTYHRRFKQRPAYIRIFVDKAIVVLPVPLYWLSFIRDLMSAQVLFHELGHHVHATLKPEYKDGEEVAEVWRKRFVISMMRKKHPVVSRLLIPFVPLIQAYRKRKAIRKR